MGRRGARRGGIFAKVFAYTIIFSALLATAAMALFSAQIVSYYRGQQLGEIQSAYEQAREGAYIDYEQARERGGPPPGIVEIAGRLHERNQSFGFYVTDTGGAVLYVTPEKGLADAQADLAPDGTSSFMVYIDGHVIHVFEDDVFFLRYGSLLKRGLAIIFAVLAVCTAASAIFARQMTRPIKTLAAATGKMADLEEMPPPPPRNDELGALSRDVYSMYGKLRETIASQRYFFSAASHELKTPVAAASALLEGMAENIGDYADHPKYLRECMKLMDAQGKTISEMLEIVSLSDGKIAAAATKTDLCRIIEALLPSYEALAEKGGLRIFSDVPEGQSCMADPRLLQKALSNVLLNAVQNTPKGGAVRIWAQGPSAGEAAGQGRLRLNVLNTGARIDEEDLPRLAAPFYRTDRARSRKDGRSGLGLTITAKALEAMGIPFAIENTEEGVLFWMELAGE